MKQRYLFALLLALLLALPSMAQARVASVPATLATSHASLLPWLEFHVDESGTDVEEIALNDRNLPFAPFNPADTLKASGTFWLRFTLAARTAGQRPETWMLDMGESIPGKPVLYVATTNDLSGRREWQEIRAGDRHVFLLPESGPEPQTCYIRLSSAPGIWFAPMLRTPHDAANNWNVLGRYAALVALCAVMLFCLLRSGGGQWRVWTGLFAAAALAQGLMGLPAAEHGRLGLRDLPSVLMPGLALMLLPHAGRHLLHSGSHSRSVDMQLLLLTLIGAVVALLPLVPGMAWLTRYLDLWPLVTICFVLTALVAVFKGLKDAKRLLLAFLLPPAATLLAIMAARMGVNPELAGAWPLLGVTLCTLVLASTRNSIISSDDLVNATINLEQPLDDPNLRIVHHEASDSSAVQAASGMVDGISGPASGGFSSKTENLLTTSNNRLLEDALRMPLDRLMREGAALGRCSLPPAVRQYSDNMLEQARHIADIISHPTHQPDAKAAPVEDEPFNLQHLMREAHDTVAPLAENANIGLAWYMPPHLGHMYKGSAHALQETLCMLLESAVRATMHGAVHFSVRRVPESEDAGHLLFTITDTGSGMPPKERSSLALSRAWELAGAHKGYLGVESSPHGATIAFTLHLECLEQDKAEAAMRKNPLVLICAESAVDRQSLSHMLDGLKCRTTSARTMAEAVQLHKGERAVLLIAHNKMALKAELGQIQDILSQSADANMPPCRILAITPDQSQWKLLSQLGFTHALTEPVNSEDLCHTVQEVLDEYAAWLDARQQANEPRGDGFAPTATENADNDADARGQEQDGADDTDGHEEQAMPEARGPETPLPGQPLLPNLLHDTRQSQKSPMQIPDLTALPDLLHFAETMGTPSPKVAKAVHAPLSELGDSLDNHLDAPLTSDTPLTMSPAEPENLTGLLPEMPTFAPLPPLSDVDGMADVANVDEDRELPGMPELNLSLDMETPEDVANAGLEQAEPEERAPEAVSAESESATDNAADNDASDEFLAASGFAGPEWTGEQPADTQEEVPPAADTQDELDTPLTIGEKETVADLPLASQLDEWGVGKPIPYVAPKATESNDQTGSQTGATPVARTDEDKKAPATEPKAAAVAKPAASKTARITLRPAVAKPVTREDSKDANKGTAEPAPKAKAKATIRLRPVTVKPQVKVNETAKPVVTASVDTKPEAKAPSEAPTAPVNEVVKPAEATQEAAPASAPADDFMDFFADMTPASSPVDSVAGASDSAPDADTAHDAVTEPQAADTPIAETLSAAPLDEPVEETAITAPLTPAEPVAPAEPDEGMENADKAEQNSGYGLPASEITALIQRLDAAADDCRTAFAAANCFGVAEAAGNIVRDCNAYGLHVLGGIAGCVERAAQAQDLGALKDLLPDLYGSVERNRISFSQQM